MQKHNYFYLVIIGVLATMIMLKDCKGREPVQVDVKYQYETDTTWMKEHYRKFTDRVKDLEAKLEKTPPKEIRYYPTPNPDNVTIEKIPDSLLVFIRDLKNENDSLRVVISDKYIKNFPMADKLIDFRLTQDSLDITSLSIAGETRQQNYPLYLGLFEYYWEDNTLHHKKRDNPLTPSKGTPWNQLYIEGGYGFFNEAAEIGLDYSKAFGKFRIRLNTNITLEKNPQLFGTAKLGYRLFE